MNNDPVSGMSLSMDILGDNQATIMSKKRLESLEDTRLEARDALRAIIYARDLAPDAMIPTPLMLAIEAARRVL